MSLFDLSGKVALITGATKGIGRGVVDRLAEHGARVVASSRDQAACDEVATQLNERYGGDEPIARGIACDIDSIGQIEQLARTAAECWGGIDILVGNAAVLPHMGNSADTPPALFDRILTTNQHHNFRLCQAVRPGMVQRGGGRMVLTGSASGHMPSPNVLAYESARQEVTGSVRGAIRNKVAFLCLGALSSSPGFSVHITLESPRTPVSKLKRPL